MSGKMPHSRGQSAWLYSFIASADGVVMRWTGRSMSAAIWRRVRPTAFLISRERASALSRRACSLPAVICRIRGGSAASFSDRRLISTAISSPALLRRPWP